MENQKMQNVIDYFVSCKDLHFKDKYSLPDRDISFDCLGFIIAVYETMNWDKEIPRFTTSLEDLLEIMPNSFGDLKIGDPICFFVPRRNQKRNYQRSFHHFGLKYSLDQMAHIGRRNNSVQIINFDDYKSKKWMLTKPLIIELMKRSV